MTSAAHRCCSLATAVRGAGPVLMRPFGRIHPAALHRSGPSPRTLLTPTTVPGGGRDRRWNTGGVGWTDRRVRRLSTAARWALLSAVLAGLFGMHVLTAEVGSSRHGALPMISTTGHADMTEPAPPPAAPVPVVMDALGGLPGIGAVLRADPGSGGVDHGAMAGCILFLVVVGGALILLLLRYRDDPGTIGPGRVAGIAVTDIRRRGPPGRWPRLALGVIRV